MKVVILAGGLGTRLAEETSTKPKPMIKIGGMPILWHIMKIYSEQGFNDFIICLGYKGYIIKEFFANYRMHTSDMTFDLGKNQVEMHRSGTEPWRVTLIDTGEASMTGGRIKRIKPYLDSDPFCLTYGDGVANVDVRKTVEFHKKQGLAATITAVQPPGRFGSLEIEGDRVKNFREKPKGDGSWINGGFFVLNPSVIDYIDNDATIWEQTPLERLARDGKLSVYKHDGFWQPLDTLRDKKHLDGLWESGKAPWKTWK